MRRRRRGDETSLRRIGNRGSTWRATVDAAGTLAPLDGSMPLRWMVAADDRWYDPRTESTTRQKWYGGTPVVETRIRVPQGDIVSRAYCVANLGGIAIVEFENESSLPVAIALTRADVLTSTPVSSATPQGADMPNGSIILPLGHRATARVGLKHDRPHVGRLPVDIPGAPQIVRGWETACEVASRIVLPDHAATSRIIEARSSLLLADGAVGDLTQLIELVRLGEQPELAITDIVIEVEKLLRRERKTEMLRWDTPHTIASAAYLCARVGEDLAVADIARAWLNLVDTPVERPPTEAPRDASVVRWAESMLVTPSASGGSCVVMPHDFPLTWRGANLECHRVIADPVRSISFAIRWHGARPALLWEVAGTPGLVVTAGGNNGEWHSTDTSGETLLSAPHGAPQEN